MLFKNRKGQSTAEYAIIMALVAAVAAGVLQVALKGGIRQKHRQAMNFMINSGNTDPDMAAANANQANIDTFSESARNTTVQGGAGYVDESVMAAGGSEKKKDITDQFDKLS